MTSSQTALTGSMFYLMDHLKWKYFCVFSRQQRFSHSDYEHYSAKYVVTIGA